MKDYVYTFVLCNNSTKEHLSERPLDADELVEIGKAFNRTIKHVSCKIVTTEALPIATGTLDRLKQETLSYKGLVRIVHGFNGIVTDWIYPAIIDYTTQRVSFYTDTDYKTKIPQQGLYASDVAKLDGNVMINEEPVQNLDLTEWRDKWCKVYEMYVPRNKEV